MARTLVAPLPPSGWGDVARKHDITMALDMINLRIDGVERRMDLIEKRMEMIEKRMDSIERRLGIVITVGLAIGLALLGLQVQIMLSLAG